MDSITHTQEELLKYLSDNFAETFVENALPDGVTLQRDKYGYFQPYVSIVFGDLQQIGSRNMASSLHHDYRLPFFISVVSPDTASGRAIANKLQVKLLGWGTDWTGQVEKRSGGLIYSLPAQMPSEEAYVFPASFEVTIQVAEIS